MRTRILFLLVAPDAVVGFVQGAGKIGPGIREREAVATAQVGQRVDCDAFFAMRFYRHQAQKVELLRYFEKHARMMLLPSLWRMYCPGRVAQRDGQSFSVHGLVF